MWSDRTVTGGLFASRATGVCGDGVVDVGEGCDDANGVDGDGCDHVCAPTGCGNGVVNAGESCDPDPDHPVECCAADGGWRARAPPCAPDRNSCTDDVCDAEGGCVHLPDTAACDDNDDRTMGDVCTAGVCRGSLSVPSVRVVYLVPDDRVPDPAYTAALEAAIDHVRIWFHLALAGRSFAVATPPVEVLL